MSHDSLPIKKQPAGTRTISYPSINSKIGIQSELVDTPRHIFDGSPLDSHTDTSKVGTKGLLVIISVGLDVLVGRCCGVVDVRTLVGVLVLVD